MVERTSPRIESRDGLTQLELLGLGFLMYLVLLPATLPVPVLREFVQERFDVSEFLTSAFMSINMVGAVLAAPLVGVFADRFGGRPRILLMGIAANAVLTASLTLDVSFPIFMALRFCDGAAHIVCVTLILSLGADLAGTRRGRVMGTLGGGLTLGVASGAAIGGQIGNSNPLVPLWTGSLVLFLALVLAAWLFVRGRLGDHRRRVPTAAPESHGSEASSDTVLRPGWRTIARQSWENRAMFVPFAFAFVDRFTVGFFTTTFTLSMQRLHGMDPSRVGILLACLLMPFALLSYPVGKLAMRSSRVHLTWIGSLVYGVGVMSLMWWPPGALPFLMVALGICSAVMFIPALLMVTDLATKTARSTAMGGFNAAGSLGFIAGPLVGGAVSQTVAGSHGWSTGYTTAFVVAGASEILVVMLTLPWLLRLRRTGRTT